jgi:hypothetical protein
MKIWYILIKCTCSKRLRKLYHLDRLKSDQFKRKDCSKIWSHSSIRLSKLLLITLLIERDSKPHILTKILSNKMRIKMLKIFRFQWVHSYKNSLNKLTQNNNKWDLLWMAKSLFSITLLITITKSQASQWDTKLRDFIHQCLALW